MEPTIHNGAFVVVAQVPYDFLKKRDIVEYRSDYVHYSVCHRIVGGWRGFWVAKGDANAFPDRGYVTRSNYVGKILLP